MDQSQFSRIYTLSQENCCENVCVDLLKSKCFVIDLCGSADCMQWLYGNLMRIASISHMHVVMCCERISWYIIAAYFFLCIAFALIRCMVVQKCECFSQVAYLPHYTRECAQSYIILYAV